LADTTTIWELPYPELGDEANIEEAVKPLAAKLETMFGVTIAKKPTALTFSQAYTGTGSTGPAFPADPDDGDEVVVDISGFTSGGGSLITTRGCEWRFRWNEAHSTWYFSGGGELEQSNGVTYNVLSGWNAGGSLDPPPRVNVPYGMEAIVEFGALGVTEGAANRLDMRVVINWAQNSSLYGVIQHAYNGSFPSSAPAVFRRKVFLPAGAMLETQWLAYGTGAVMTAPFVSVKPLKLT
jgi:hypothetical protein